MGEISYTNSLKFQPTHPPGSDEWNLRLVLDYRRFSKLKYFWTFGWIKYFRITNPGLSDSGAYECQINTEPKRSRLYHLEVVISKVISPHSKTPSLKHEIRCFQAKIHGDRDVFVQAGSDINLTCTALSTPEQPERVSWRHNNLDLHRLDIEFSLEVMTLQSFVRSTRGGIAIVTEKRRRMSNLLMYRYD